jgi:RNA polymerase sigma factor (sigma-70 family)
MGARIWRHWPVRVIEQEDAEQMAAIGLLAAVRAFEETRAASWEGYMVRRVRGAVLNGLRRERAVLSSGDSTTLPVADTSPDPLAQAVASQARRKVRYAMAILTPKERESLIETGPRKVTRQAMADRRQRAMRRVLDDLRTRAMLLDAQSVRRD